MTVPAHDLRSALALGSMTGLRTTSGWAGLVARGRIGDGRLRTGVALAVAGEALGDKLPITPPRGDPPALAGRVASGALVGRLVGGGRGAGVGAAAAAATTYASERLRALVVARIPVPDPVYGVVEDAVALGLASAMAGERPPDELGGAEETGESPPRSQLGAAARGLLAAAAGTAAMTAAQTALQRAGGGRPSFTPADVSRNLLQKTTGRRVPRRQRTALNAATHVLYGTAWGAPFGLIVGSRSLSQRPGRIGLGLGAAVWAGSLVGLPLLGAAPAPWRQSLRSLAPDLALHLVYGTATAAIYGALGA